MTDGIVNISVFLAGLSLVALGVGWRDPAAASIVVGSVLMVAVIVSRIRIGGRT
jgi:divalent metal cation (Fe/Co/Zn/Cd) transporter